PDRYEIYTATLQKRLPKFRLPLAPDDRDTVLDLQAGFTRCYELSGYSHQIDYSTDPPVPLDHKDRPCLHDLLRRAMLRCPGAPAAQAAGFGLPAPGAVPNTRRVAPPVRPLEAPPCSLSAARGSGPVRACPAGRSCKSGPVPSWACRWPSAC